MSQNSYFKIKISSIHPDKPTLFNTYILLGGKHTLYLRSGDKLDIEKIRSLSQKDSGDIFYILESDRAAYKKYIQDALQAADLSVADKAHILRDSSLAIMEELFEHPDVNVALDNSKPIITEFVNFMDAEPEAMQYLIGLTGHDFYTYNHSLDVSIYSLGLGQVLGFGKKDLEELGLGSLFHDVGKRQVSLDILCKKGALSDEEWQQMQKHPQFGLMILNENKDISDAIKAACFEHHESWAGNGYPQQLQRDEIHPFARIVAITDTYDALTTQRSYNVPMKPLDAVEMMKERIKGRYDPEMLKAMYSVLFKLKAA